MIKLRENLISAYDRDMSDKRNFLELNLLKSISKSKLFICKKTGLLFHKKSKKFTIKANKFWTDKAYGKITKKNYLFNSKSPFFLSRHMYVAAFADQKIKLKNKKILDFACGDGTLLEILCKYFFQKKLYGTEISRSQILKIKKNFKNQNLKMPELIQCDLEVEKKLNFNTLKKNLKFDVGFITWTFCNIHNPLKALNLIKNSIKNNGFLVVAESSRFLVPFKKDIKDYFSNSIKQEINHPFHFSFNSLANLFKLFNFELVFTNNYILDEKIVLIFKKKKSTKSRFIVDDNKKVIKYLKKWKEASAHN